MPIDSSDINSNLLPTCYIIMYREYLFVLALLLFVSHVTKCEISKTQKVTGEWKSMLRSGREFIYTVRYGPKSFDCVHLVWMKNWEKGLLGTRYLPTYTSLMWTMESVNGLFFLIICYFLQINYTTTKINIPFIEIIPLK